MVFQILDLQEVDYLAESRQQKALFASASALFQGRAGELTMGTCAKVQPEEMTSCALWLVFGELLSLPRWGFVNWPAAVCHVS